MLQAEWPLRGSVDPGVRNPRCGPQFIGGEPGDSFDPGGFGGGFGGGGGGSGFRREMDEETLRAVADATDAEYYPAESADQLKTVLQNLPTNTITRHEVTELSVAFAALVALFATLSVFLGQARRPVP